MSATIVLFKERLDPHSGFSKHILEVSRRLAPSGYRFVLLTSRVHLSASTRIPDEIEVRVVGGHPYAYMRTRSRLIRSILDEVKPDLLDVHGGPGTVLAARPWGVPWVFSLHAGWFTLRDYRGVSLWDGLHEPKLREWGTLLNVGMPLGGLVRALRSRRPRAVAVPTRRLQQALQPQVECPVWHLPSGVDPKPTSSPKRSPEEAKTALDLPPEDPLILFFGKAQLLRGIDTLLEAFAEVAAAHSRARLLLLLRPDSSQRRVARLVKAHPARDRIRLIAKTVDPQPYLAAADLVALPFRTGIVLPAQPLTLLEAMACGKPVLSTEIPVVQEIIVDGEDGLLVPPGDPRRLAERILWALEHPEKATELGERARRRAREYSWDEIAARTERFYEYALEPGSEPEPEPRPERKPRGEQGG